MVIPPNSQIIRFGARMRSRNWLVLGMLAFPTLASAQTLKAADLVGGWRAELEHADSEVAVFGGVFQGGDIKRGWLVLWPDGLWWYGGGFMYDEHGGARWRLVGDTLWLGNDYTPYFHPIIQPRIEAINAKGYGLAVMDTAVINQRPPFDIPDSIYWSKTFRETTACASGTPCDTWVYKVSKQGQQLHLVRLDSLSRLTGAVATKAVLTRDTLVHCLWISGC